MKNLSRKLALSLSLVLPTAVGANLVTAPAPVYAAEATATTVSDSKSDDKKDSIDTKWIIIFFVALGLGGALVTAIGNAIENALYRSVSNAIPGVPLFF